MELITVKMPDAVGVGAGQTAVFTLPIGRTYHNLLLSYAGVTLAQIDAVRLKMNGSTVMELGSGTDIDNRNKFDGLEAAAGLLLINFERESLDVAAQRYAYVIGTGFQWQAGDARANNEIKTLQLEIDVNAAAVGTALSLKAKQSKPQPLGLIRRMAKITKPIVSGESQITDLPRNKSTHGQLNRFFIKCANITAFKIEKDNFVMVERTKAENERYQLNGWRVPQTGIVAFDPTEDGIGTNLIDVFDAQDFQLKPTASAGETITIFAEYVGVL